MKHLLPQLPTPFSPDDQCLIPLHFNGLFQRQNMLARPDSMYGVCHALAGITIVRWGKVNFVNVMRNSA